jgi:hypothetical protein
VFLVHSYGPLKLEQIQKEFLPRRQMVDVSAMGCIIFKVEYLSILQLFQIVKLCFANFG